MKKFSLVMRLGTTLSSPRFLLGLACFFLSTLAVYYRPLPPEIPLAFLVAGLLALGPVLRSMSVLALLLWFGSTFLFLATLLFYLGQHFL